MSSVMEELKREFGDNRIRENELMSLHTTFKIGGPAEYYFEAYAVEEIVSAVRFAKKRGISFFVVGGGSNMIVSDRGIKGLVIKNNCRRFEVLGLTGKVKNQKIGVDKAMVFAESGVIINQLVRYTIDQGLSGLEYQLGLPGTVGGGVYMNSNFPRKGVHVGDVLSKAALLTSDGEIKEVSHDYFHFAYDKSVLQTTGEIVLSVVFGLKPVEKKELWARGTEALEYRSSTQPKGASAGCTFRNISTDEALKVSTPAAITSAGYLIDKAGLKGKRVGDAMISDMHANFILNMGQAKAEDVVGLVRLIKEEVYKKFNVHLALEVKTVGF